MRYFRPPDSVAPTLRDAVTSYLSDIGSERLRRVAAPEMLAKTIDARLVLRAAQLGIEEARDYVHPESCASDPFDRLRVFLFSGDKPVGFVDLKRRGEEAEAGDEGGVGEFTVDYVSAGGAEDALEALADVERWPDSGALEPYLLEVPALYLRSLALMGSDGEAAAFRVISPPYTDHVRRKAPAEFREFLRAQVVENARIFGEGKSGYA